MRKRILSMMLAVVLIMTAVNLSSITAEAAGKTTVYQTNAIDVTKFVKSKGKLTVKAQSWEIASVKDKKSWVKTAEGAIFGKNKSTGTKKVTYKISKKCKWSWSDTMRNSGKSSYSKIKKTAEQARKAYRKYGVDGSFGTIQIFVKNRKIVRVNIIVS